MKNKKVVVVGSLNYDLILTQERLPYKGETLYADDLIQGLGGKGANQAVQCAKLGLETTLIGTVGSDRFGDALIGSMQSVGVNADKIQRRGQSGLGLVNVLYDGDYHSTILKGANYTITIEDIENETELLESADYIILQQEIPQFINEYIIKNFNENAILILNNAPARSIKYEALQNLDYLIVNETEAEFMINKKVDNIDQAFEAVQLLHSEIHSTVIITLGKSGVVLKDNENIFHVPSNKVKAIDTTGAGDSFIGGVVYGLSQGYSTKKVIQFANNVSSLTVKHKGGSESFPLLKECIEMNNSAI
ncbi:ribokinase [Staphylococcus shinii]|uniref:ribokinase n=1 Tax=Staphylococcus shinii TaxID=2912228 RepID=UPI003CEF13DB